MEKRLYKNTDKKMISGVLAGFADYLNIDVTILRIGYVLLSLVMDGFPGLILYIVLAIVMPDMNENDRKSRSYRNDNAYRTYEKDKEDKTYTDVNYKENPSPDEIQNNYKQSGGSYTPDDRK